MSTALHPPSAPDASAPAPRPPRRRAIAGRAPARPTAAAAIHSIGAATSVLLWLVAIGALLHEPILIPPLAAGGAVGYGVPAVAGSRAWARRRGRRVTLALVMLARTPHSPACATAVVVVLRTPVAERFVPLLFGSTVLIVLTGWAASRVRRKAPRYPAYWW